MTEKVDLGSAVPANDVANAKIQSETLIELVGRVVREDFRTALAAVIVIFGLTMSSLMMLFSHSHSQFAAGLFCSIVAGASTFLGFTVGEGGRKK